MSAPDIRMGAKTVRPPKEWTVRFALPRYAVRDGRTHEDTVLAWTDLRLRWQSWGYALTPDGRVEFIAD